MRRSQTLQRNRRKEQNKIEDIRRTYTVRAVVQRVTHASVTVDGEVLGKIGKEMCIRDSGKSLFVGEGKAIFFSEQELDSLVNVQKLSLIHILPKTPWALE